MFSKHHICGLRGQGELGLGAQKVVAVSGRGEVAGSRAVAMQIEKRQILVCVPSGGHLTRHLREAVSSPRPGTDPAVLGQLLGDTARPARPPPGLRQDGVWGSSACSCVGRRSAPRVSEV